MRRLIAAVAIWLVLILPASMDALAPDALLRLPLELPALLLIASTLGQGLAGRAYCVLAAIALTLLAVLKIADMTAREVLGRAFNPVADLTLVDASVRVVAGSFGTGVAVLAVVASVLLVCIIAASMIWALRQWQGRSRGPWPAAGAAAMLALIAGVTASGTTIGAVDAAATRYAIDRVALVRRTAVDLADFRRAAARDPLADAPGLLQAIDRDVLVIFLESYGRASFDVPFYAETHLPNLRRAEAEFAQAGLAVRSGFLISPTQGGQSWLAHESFSSGLWTDDQSRYLAALASGRQGLFHIARTAGFQTAAIMPAVTMPWPEAETIGFDTVLAAADLGYRGQPFNWVTMPDQFTLASMDRLLRQGERTRHLFAQIALISSHAPWVPVPRLIDWDDLGDGRVFDGMASSGDPPSVVWRDRDRMRQQYRLSIDYVLQTVVSYALRHAENPPLMIVLGDHQAAASIALTEIDEVPIHVIGPEALVARTARWGLAPGLIPPVNAPAIPMQDMRDLILRGFSATDLTPPA
ncbi:sulfatase-like hydrolase/transferase [Paracoccus sp. TK19116]|uniref:Sulfatase-like hydrolase/transferase n=1 Tax=Paracoccus albicereus TaxID=2922394 RepID=A0ABT1MUN9_9RHOB|nr:sulfatase-like hydrolase/transferase [Paracoccus albicereus]MCQ0972020.1 sulfatase-like hydrolase/transferase [Paracoccus albicereus]